MKSETSTTDASLSTAAPRRVGELRALDSGGLIRVRQNRRCRFGQVSRSWPSGPRSRSEGHRLRRVGGENIENVESRSTSEFPVERDILSASTADVLAVAQTHGDDDYGICASIAIHEPLTNAVGKVVANKRRGLRAGVLSLVARHSAACGK